MIYVLGDCFVRDLVHTNPSVYEHKNLMLRGIPGQGPFKVKNFKNMLSLIQESIDEGFMLPNYHQLYNKDMECSYFNVMEKCDHKEDYDKCYPYLKTLNKLNKDKRTIVFWFGHADNRDSRCTDENRKSFIENNVDFYINSIKQYMSPYFDNILIAEPFPIFVNLNQLDNQKPYMLEKLENEKIFISRLRKVAKENNLPIIITQEEILASAGVDFFDSLKTVPELYANAFMLPIDQQQRIMDLLYKKTLDFDKN